MLRIKHHLDNAELMSCASGSQPEALAAVISTHLSLCSICRQELKIHSLIGETLFHNLSDVDETSSLSIRPFNEPLPHLSSQSPNTYFQGVLQRIISGKGDQIVWKKISHGILDCPLGLSNKLHSSLKLLRLEPNIKLASLQNSGAQIMIVLDGGLNDNSDTLQKGDVINITSDKDDIFVSDSNKGCVCLIASNNEINLDSLSV